MNSSYLRLQVQYCALAAVDADIVNIRIGSNYTQWVVDEAEDKLKRMQQVLKNQLENESGDKVKLTHNGVHY